MSKCIKCGEEGPHFVPPSFGEEGFFYCQEPEIKELEKRTQKLAVALRVTSASKKLDEAVNELIQELLKDE